MKWFQKHIGLGSRLALFALAVQFALSWGHTHVHAAPSWQTIASVSIPDAPNDDQQHHATDTCDICDVMAMASTALFAAPPTLSLPEAARFAYQDIKSEFDHVAALSGAPQPRGPPAS